MKTADNAKADELTTFHNRRGERLRTVHLTASNAKKGFGRILEAAIKGDVVVITKHDAPKAVLISLEAFNALSQASQSALKTLSEEFDSLFVEMQTTEARRSMKTAFDASPRQLGKAAVRVARKRG